MLTRPAALAAAVLLLAGCTLRDPTTAPPATVQHAQPTTSPPSGAAEPAANGCPDTATAGCASVVRIKDGDTLVVTVDPSMDPTTVRLVGIDTPETHHPTKPVGCYGPEAAAATAKLAPPGTRVKVELDREARDRYGRTLAYLYLPSGRMLNAELVWAGYARTLTIKPNTAHRAELAAKQAEAKAAGRGLWTACAAPTTTTNPVTSRGVHYADCAAARAVGAAPLHRGEPGYRPDLDRDGDGVACE